MGKKIYVLKHIWSCLHITNYSVVVETLAPGLLYLVDTRRYLVSPLYYVISRGFSDYNLAKINV